MNFKVLDKIFIEGLRSAIPEGALTVSMWAETRRVVSLERVANPALAGSWRNDRTPYLVGVMNAVNNPSVNEILFFKSSQVGGTEAGNNIIGYYIDIDPATILYVAETEPKARAWSVESFAPMIRDTPALASIFGDAKERDSSNMIEAKAFRGGHFALGWATSPSTLSSRPRRVVVTDETWAFVGTKEGDAVKLAEARTKTAGSERKIIHITTPRDKYTGGTTKDGKPELHPMLNMWEQSSQEKYFVPCPHCNEFQFLEWKNVRWDKDPDEAYYVCVSGCVIEHDEKFGMLSKGEWRSLNPDYVGNRRGFWINELYSPFTTWGEMASAFLEAKKHRDTLKVFINTRLAEPWEEKDEEIEFGDLKFNQTHYEAQVPRGVLVLTAGVDIQDDRIEIEVVGWGKDFESWSIAYHVIEGSPGLFDVWDDLYDYLTSEFEGANGEIFKIRAAGIDTGGHHTDKTYSFCKANKGRRWYALKGSSLYNQPIVSRPKTVEKNGVKIRLFSVGTDTAKDEIFSYLRVQPENDHSDEILPGFCHFPESYDESYFKQLCAEKKVTRYKMGVAHHSYEKVTKSARNEALDCRVYAIAARNILNPKILKRGKKRTNSGENTPENGENLPKNGQNLSDFDEKLERKSETKPRKRRIKVKNSFISGARKGGNFATNY